DLAVMRSVPNLQVFSPADATESYAAMAYILDSDGPVYCRFGRFAVPVIFDPAAYSFRPGKGMVLADGTDVTLIATGIMVSAALEARELLKADGIDAAVLNIHTIKPLDADLVTAYAAKTGAVVTAEEHSIIGGLGGAVAECLAERAPTRMARVGMRDCFGKSASADVLLNYFGLNAEGIAEQARRLLAAH
ncbi:MAG: transketolase family protein, partial [Clostridia bacterium]|nr:transketolase family protein [Clostridia bacterium]